MPMTTDWFTENHTLVYFVYGLVFFILGIAILLQTRSYSRLRLARNLPWLGWFGILHGMYEWGDIFIPLQMTTMGENYFPIFDFIQHTLLAFSFWSLFQFGIELLRPSSRAWRWIRLIPTMVLSVWLVGPMILGYIFTKDIHNWHLYGYAVTRYMLCFPGSILSGIGLIRQARIQIDPLKVPKIGLMFKIAAVALFAYAILAGLITPKGNFFPSTLINTEWFTATFYAPPPIFRSLAGVILLFSIIRALEVFNIETDRMIRSMEQGQVMAVERERIARDLHDGALQQVYASGLLAQSLRKKLEGSQATEANNLITTINQAIEQLRAFLPQLKPEPQSIDLAGALLPIIQDAQRNVSISTHWDTKEIPSLTPEQTSHLTALFTEVLSNIIRHSRSDNADIRLFCKNHHLIIEVEDFGVGIPVQAEPGYGIKNMRDRAKLLGAYLTVDSVMGKGTVVKIDLPMEDKNGSHSPVDRR
jgi:signal transduction histidine kinase